MLQCSGRDQTHTVPCGVTANAGLLLVWALDTGIPLGSSLLNPLHTSVQSYTPSKRRHCTCLTSTAASLQGADGQQSLKPTCCEFELCQKIFGKSQRAVPPALPIVQLHKAGVGKSLLICDTDVPLVTGCAQWPGKQTAGRRLASQCNACTPNFLTRFGSAQCDITPLCNDAP